MAKKKPKIWEGDKNLPLDRLSILQAIARRKTMLRNSRDHCIATGQPSLSLAEKHLISCTMRALQAYYKELYEDTDNDRELWADEDE